MTRRAHAIGIAALTLACLTAGAAAGVTQPAPAPRAPRPNIVWISNEDMSPRLGAYGDRLARTPVLDRLARESIRYTRAFATAPVCAPSRAAIITGMYQTAIGAQHMRTTEDGVPELPGPYLAVPPFYVKAFPEYLRAAGYFTSNRSKTDYQFGVPFTIWDELGDTAHWRNRPDPKQPFFAVFNLEVTHESRIFPSSPARKGKPLVTNPSAIEVPPYYPDTPLVRQELARMYDNIADMDRQVGEILDALTADGLADNTIVVYWSDHGDGVPRAKRSLYDAGLRVPLMIRWPAALASPLKPGTVSEEMVSLIDLAPTMLSLAGVTVPTHLQGRTLVGPRATAAPEIVFAARDRMDLEYDMMRAARDARYLYIRNFAPQLPYAGHIIYRNQSDIMQEWLRLQADGLLRGPATLWMRHRSAGRGAVRHRHGSASDSRPLVGPQSSSGAGAPARGGDRLDGSRRRSGADQRSRDDPTDVARRRAARDGSAVHRGASIDREADAGGHDDAVRADGDLDLRADTRRVDCVYDRGR